MNEQDTQAWERELNHAAKMQAQREGWQPTTEMISAIKHFNEMVEQVNEK
ncbi:hypothetical protein ACS8E2_05460 [Psychrobacter glaciei]